MNSRVAIVFLLLFLGQKVFAQQICDSVYVSYIYEKQLYPLIVKNGYENCANLSYKEFFVKSVFRLKHWNKLNQISETESKELQKTFPYLAYIYQYVHYEVRKNSGLFFSELEVENWLKNYEKTPNSNLKEVYQRLVNVEVANAFLHSNKTFISKLENQAGFESILYPDLKDLLQKEKTNYPDHQKKVSPAIAATLSAIVPGSGRLLSGEWYDGFQSAFFVLGSAYLTYMHRNEFPYNAFFGTVTGVFYLSNITGSYKSAKRYNALELNKLRDRVELHFSDLPVIYQ